MGIRGVWQPQTETLFDICITETAAQSHAQHSITAMQTSPDEEKKRKYVQAMKGHRASFSP